MICLVAPALESHDVAIPFKLGGCPGVANAARLRKLGAGVSTNHPDWVVKPVFKLSPFNDTVVAVRLLGDTLGRIQPENRKAIPVTAIFHCSEVVSRLPLLVSEVLDPTRQRALVTTPITSTQW